MPFGHLWQAVRPSLAWGHPDTPTPRRPPVEPRYHIRSLRHDPRQASLGCSPPLLAPSPCPAPPGPASPGPAPPRALPPGSASPGPARPRALPPGSASVFAVSRQISTVPRSVRPPRGPIRSLRVPRLRVLAVWRQGGASACRVAAKTAGDLCKLVEICRLTASERPVKWEVRAGGHHRRHVRT